MNTKEKIVKTSLRLFLQKGFYNVSMQDIAKEIGISKPAIYHYFKNKDKLIEGVLDLFSEKTKIFMKDYYKNTEDYKESLRDYLHLIPAFKNIEEILLDEKKERFNHSFNEFLLSVSKYNPILKERISKDIIGAIEKKVKININAQIKGIIKDDIDPFILSLMIHSIAEGLSFIYEIIPDDKMDENIDKVFNLFWKLLKRKED